jgi:hypothetical protein
MPDVGGDPRGYLEFTKGDGDKAYIKWTKESLLSPGPDSKSKVLANGGCRGQQIATKKSGSDR